MSDTPRYPDITVRLTGEDGNVFNLIALVRRRLPVPVQSEFVDDVTSSRSYDEALRRIMAWVVVE